MNITDNVVGVLRDRATEIADLQAKITAIDAKISSGQYSHATIQNEFAPEKGKIRLAIQEKAAQAEREAGQVVADWLQERRKEDALNPDDLTDDTKLLNAGVKLNERDILSMLERNQGNRTMTQIIMRYVKENGIAGNFPPYELASAAAQRTADTLTGITRMYINHWIANPKALDMLERLFYA